jgi:hypothetical protein
VSRPDKWERRRERWEKFKRAQEREQKSPELKLVEAQEMAMEDMGADITREY